jgi:hypothetical protein
MKTYRLSPAGRRTTLVLLVGALIIWAFAIWTLRSTLVANATESLSVGQIIPALLMIVLIVATPLVIWNLVEEWSSTYTLTEAGIQFAALGVDITYPWVGIRAVRAVDDDTEEPMDEIWLDRDYTASIRNPLTRFLHAQSYGRTKLPIYAGLMERDLLIAQIRERAALTEQHVAASAESHA